MGEIRIVLRDSRDVPDFLPKFRGEGDCRQRFSGFFGLGGNRNFLTRVDDNQVLRIIVARLQRIREMVASRVTCRLRIVTDDKVGAANAHDCCRRTHLEPLVGIMHLLDDQDPRQTVNQIERIDFLIIQFSRRSWCWQSQPTRSLGPTIILPRENSSVALLFFPFVMTKSPHSRESPLFAFLMARGRVWITSTKPLVTKILPQAIRLPQKADAATHRCQGA